MRILHACMRLSLGGDKMNLFTVLFLAAGLSMDAFAVSICKGLALPKATFKNALIVGIWFGTFQGLMPLIGYLLGIQFTSYITSFCPWIAFVLLFFIGGNMLREALTENDTRQDGGLGIQEMFLLAIATSIDALAAGVTFACIPVSLSSSLTPFLNTLCACVVTALTTCLFSVAGVGIGHIFGSRFQKKAEIAGGIVLILLGIKILLGL